MDKERVRQLADNVNRLLELHERKHQNMLKLFKLCIYQLEFQPHQHTKQTCIDNHQKRKSLLSALKQLTVQQTQRERKGDHHV